MICPARLSATNASPFGASRICRGPLRSVAYRSTLKPAGTCGHASAGRGTSVGLLRAESVANGLGRSAGRNLPEGPGLHRSIVDERRRTGDQVLRVDLLSNGRPGLRARLRQQRPRDERDRDAECLHAHRSDLYERKFIQTG